MEKSKQLREAAIFFCLTLGLSFFVFWGPIAFLKIPTISFVDNNVGPTWAIILFVFGGFVPSGVALFLTWKMEGKAGVKEIGRRIIQFDIGWQWYIATVLVVLLGTVGQLIISLLLGNTFDYSLFIRQIGSLLPLIILGPLSEEIGWRGYALDRLQTKWNALASSLVVGIMWGLWHFPLFMMIGTSQNVLNIPFLGFLCSVISLSVLFTWLHNNTGGSIWTAIFLHWVFTYSSQVIASGVTRSGLYNWLEFVPYAILAVVVTVVWKPKKLMLKDV